MWLQVEGCSPRKLVASRPAAQCSAVPCTAAGGACRSSRRTFPPAAAAAPLLTPPTLPQIEVLETLGEGGFARVHCAAVPACATAMRPSLVALKTFLRGEDLRRTVAREARAARLCAGGRVPMLLGVALGEAGPYGLLFELCEGGDMEGFAR